MISSPSWNEARELGLKFFHGKQCPHGHTGRYVSTKACVICLREQVKEDNAKKRRERGAEIRAASGGKYEGKPCRTCGGTTRYVSADRCVACHRARVQHARLQRVAAKASEA